MLNFNLKKHNNNNNKYEEITWCGSVIKREPVEEETERNIRAEANDFKHWPLNPGTQASQCLDKTGQNACSA